jgi:hypothetical protein
MLRRLSLAITYFVSIVYFLLILLPSADSDEGNQGSGIIVISVPGSL